MAIAYWMAAQLTAYCRPFFEQDSAFCIAYYVFWYSHLSQHSRQCFGITFVLCITYAHWVFVQCTLGLLAYCVCVLRIAHLALGLLVHCVLRIECLHTPLWVCFCTMYCVLCACTPHFGSACVLRIPYCALRIRGFEPGCVLRIAYCVLRIRGFEPGCVLRIAYTYCVFRALSQVAYCVLRIRIAYSG